MQQVLWVLVVLYAFRPIDGQQKAGQSSAGQSRSANEHNGVARPPAYSGAVAFVNQQIAHKEEQDSKEDPQSYFHALVAPNNIPNVLLVAVGILGIILAWRTVNATREAAKAALLSAQAVISTERPWITVDIVQDAPRSFTVIGNNVGRTPAKIRAIWGDIIELPEGEVLPPIYPYGEGGELRLRPTIFPPTVKDRILDRLSTEYTTKFPPRIGSRLYIIGRITYVDALPATNQGSIQHETLWCALLATPQGPAITGFAPPEYNDYT